MFLVDDDLTAVNTQEQPDRVIPRAHPGVSVTAGVLQAELPPASWSLVVLDVR